ncbi:MAG: DUF2807 domain-containing protein [Muribaculaceae bacterium]|nr:DUF2807 domain-containing protein [Muribaculaceae bacterium]
MKPLTLLLFLALAIVGFPSMAADKEPIVKTMRLNGILNGKVSIDGLCGTYNVDEEFPNNRFIRISGLGVYVSRVMISKGADNTLNISLQLPSWLKMPTENDLQVSITGPKLTYLTLSNGSDIAVQGFYSTPESLSLNVKGKSHLLFNNPINTSTVTATVSSGSTFIINAVQADEMKMTLGENSQGYIGGGTLIKTLNINATGGSTAFTTNIIVDKADFNATDLSQIGYYVKPKSLVSHTNRGGIIKQSQDVPEVKGLFK